jgi:very-short-patch-repair endonuclease
MREAGWGVANEVARRLRNNLTPQERKLWRRLRALRLSHGFHFRRQAPIGRFIVDFVCFDKKLVIEVDGGQHGIDALISKDKVRDDYFARNNFRVLRFWNSEVNENLDGVMERLLLLLEAPPPRRALLADPPRKGEG